MERIKLSVSFLPSEFLIGISTRPGEAYCDSCIDYHRFYAVQIGFLFFVINILVFEKTY
jgi:hypothetical protein